MTDRTQHDDAAAPVVDVLGVVLLSVAGGFGVYAFVYGLGSGQPMTLPSVGLVVVLAVSTVVTWWVGRRSVVPLVAGLLVAAGVLGVLDAPAGVAVYGLVAALVVARRLLRPRPALAQTRPASR